MSVVKDPEDFVDALVTTYEEHLPVITTFRDQLVIALERSGDLQSHIHSVRTRMKDPAHLREKLTRKMAECEQAGREFAITTSNLLTSVTDLAGVRLLHLYTRQMKEIDGALRDIFAEHLYELEEEPFARTWDDETREFFRSIGIRTEVSPTMYTSVHYVIGSASRTRVTCEIQIRTLAEELWGEVDHSMNYPTPSTVLAVREELKVLARVISGATRLVDAIFAVDAAEREVQAP
jgi:ppGpp synthetase/RelA/SpoT-type nucleotidyltranferase